MQQLSLALELLNSELAHTSWFQNLLSTLKIRQEPAWTDNFGKSLRQCLQQQSIAPVKTLIPSCLLKSNSQMWKEGH